MADGATIGEVGEHAFLARLCERLASRPGRASEGKGVAAGAPSGGPSPGKAAPDRTPGGAEPGGTAAAQDVLVGPGDDCAVVAPSRWPLALTTDSLLEGVHFRAGWLCPAEIGRRAVAVSLSDLAAMGASAAYTLAAVAAPTSLPAADLEALLDGCAQESEAAGACLVGGNLTRAERLAVTVTALGTIEGPTLRRAGARAGDLLIVTGTLGAAAAAVALWLEEIEPPSELRRRFAAPQARVAAGRALAAAGAHAAIDLSDGLLADLGHLCAASDVGAVVERERLPRLPAVAERDAHGADFAATGGEDYELLVACPPELGASLESLATACAAPLTVIGRCTPPGTGIVLLGADGRPHEPHRTGFDHFRTQPRAGGARGER